MARNKFDIDEDVNIRFDNLEITPTKELLANKIGQMVQTEGIIKGILEPSFYYTNIYEYVMSVMFGKQ